MTQNPFLQDWGTELSLPPFDQIKLDDFAPAFETLMTEASAEYEAIRNNPETPNFKNTIETAEKAGRRFSRMLAVFWVLNGSDTSDDMQKLAKEFSPKTTAWSLEIAMHPDWVSRVKAVYENKDALDLTDEQLRVTELYYQSVERSGGFLEGPKQTRLKAIMERLSVLGTEFTQNLLADENDWVLNLEEADLDGCPEFLKSAAIAAGKDRGDSGPIITLSRSLIVPFLQFSPRRDLRQIAFEAWGMRGQNPGKTDNRDIVKETLALRQERAELLGFKNFAEFKLKPEMAGHPDAVEELLLSVWGPAKRAAEQDAEILHAMLSDDGIEDDLRPWDWRYYAEKRRQSEFAIDEAEAKPYFELNNMIAASFDVARRLFGLSFHEIDAPLNHPDAKAWEVKQGDRHMAVFIGDYFARASKRSGAWCTRYRPQDKLNADTRPIVVNVCNFAKAAEGEPNLLSFDDARTLFHEFGHALHTILSDVKYPYISGTSVARDFVELPSQLYEHWLSVPEILTTYARHAETDAPIPQDMLDKLLAAENFDQGFATVEYTSSALVDLAFHTETPPADPMQRQEEILNRIGMPSAITMRHATPHFAHVFSGDGYSSGYYSYMWSEVMDADAFAAFKDTGNAFDPTMAQKLREHIYSAGGSRAPEELYKSFRGSLPNVDALLKGRGLVS